MFVNVRNFSPKRGQNVSKVDTDNVLTVRELS